MNDAKSPYLAAREEWEEKYGSFVASAHSWKIIALISLFLAVGSTGGAIYIASQHRVVPYIIAVDELGFRMPVTKADAANKVNVNKVIIAELAEFIEEARDVVVDAQIQRQKVLDAYVHITKSSPAATKLNEFFRDNDPFKRAKSETVFAEVRQVLPLKDNAYQVQWIEKVMDRKSGQTKSLFQYQAIFYVSRTEPSDEKTIIKNPVGLIINDFNWSREL